MERSYGIPHKENDQDCIHQQEMLKRNPLRIIKPGDPDFERTVKEIMENQQNDKKTQTATSQKSAKKLIKCKSCGAETNNHGRGLCPKCYRREEREGTLDANYPSDYGGTQKEHCAECGTLTKIESRGMCRKCYQRWHYHNKRKAKTAGTQRVEQAKENLRKNLDRKKEARAQSQQLESRVGTANQNTSPAPDEVNHPAHYTGHPSGIECIDITEHMNFCLGNALKYIWRAGQKGDPIQDLEKALWYIRREIKRMKEQQA